MDSWCTAEEWPRDGRPKVVGMGLHYVPAGCKTSGDRVCPLNRVFLSSRSAMAESADRRPKRGRSGAVASDLEAGGGGGVDGGSPSLLRSVTEERNIGGHCDRT